MTIVFLYGVLIFTPEVYFGQRSSDEYGPIESIKKDYCMHVSKEWYTFHLNYRNNNHEVKNHIMCDGDMKKGIPLEDEVCLLLKSPSNDHNHYYTCNVSPEHHIHEVRSYSNTVCRFEQIVSHWGSQHPECEITSVDVPYRTYTVLYSQRCPVVEWPVWHYVVWGIFYVWFVLLS